MRKAFLFLLAALGCSGGANWEGTFSGVVTTSGTCSDGTSVNPTPSQSGLAISENGNTLTWQVECGATVTASTNGNTASVAEYSCPATTNSNGVTIAATVTGGTLTLDGNSLSENLAATYTLSGASTGTCSIVISGTLARQ